MQQPVNNRWLSPALRDLADHGAWTTDRQQALYRAGLEAREAIALQTTGARPSDGDRVGPRVYAGRYGRAGAGVHGAGAAPAIRPRSTGPGWLRQALLSVAMAGLLLGSIAFSFLAWSGTQASSPIGFSADLLTGNPAPGAAESAPAGSTPQALKAQNAIGARAADASPGQRVRLLRQENSRLHERASALRSRLR